MIFCVSSAQCVCVCCPVAQTPRVGEGISFIKKWIGLPEEPSSDTHTINKPDDTVDAEGEEGEFKSAEEEKQRNQEKGGTSWRLSDGRERISGLWSTTK